jgi:hypothetical protein
MPDRWRKKGAKSFTLCLTPSVVSLKLIILKERKKTRQRTTKSCFYVHCFYM